MEKMGRAGLQGWPTGLAYRAGRADADQISYFSGKLSKIVRHLISSQFY